MKILVLSDLPPYVVGGAETQAARLSEWWLAGGHEVEIAGHRIPSGILRLGEQQAQCCNIRVIYRLGRLMRGLTFFFSLAKLLVRRQRNYDIIYCRFLGEAAVSVCLLKALGVIRLPLVAVPASAGERGDFGFIRSIPCWRMLIPLINAQCSAVNFIAPSIEPYLAQLGVRVRHYSNIPNGIYCPELPQRNFPAYPRKLLFVGRLTFQKGLDILCKALSQVKQEQHQFQLMIIGEGEQRDQLERLIVESDLLGEVKLSGIKSPGEVWNALSEADAFILPSRYEGLSNAALEAMAAGLPIIITRCGGIDVYIESNMGWVCEPENVEDLATAIMAMLDLPAGKLQAMGMRTQRLIQEKFALTHVACQYIELFELVLTKQQTRNSSKSSTGGIKRMLRR